MSAALTIRPEERAELEAEGPRNAAALAQLETFKIASVEDLRWAEETMLMVKERYRALEEKRTSITKPLNAAKRAVDDLFNPATKPLARAELLLKAEIGRFELAQRAAQAAAMEAVATGAAPPSALVAAIPSGHVAGVSIRESWAWEVVDIEAVPRQCMSVDPGKVKAVIDYANKAGHEPAIPGIRFYKQATVAGRVS